MGICSRNLAGPLKRPTLRNRFDFVRLYILHIVIRVIGGAQEILIRWGVLDINLCMPHTEKDGIIHG